MNDDRYIVVWVSPIWEIRDTHAADRYSDRDSILVAFREQLDRAAKLAGDLNASEER